MAYSKKENNVVENTMLDKFTEKLVEGAMSGYKPRLEALSQVRVEELAVIRAKVRTQPQEVEAWFDIEISKASNMDIGEILKKIRF